MFRVLLLGLKAERDSRVEDKGANLSTLGKIAGWVGLFLFHRRSRCRNYVPCGVVLFNLQVLLSGPPKVTLIFRRPSLIRLSLIVMLNFSLRYSTFALALSSACNIEI